MLWLIKTIITLYILAGIGIGAFWFTALSLEDKTLVATSEEVLSLWMEQLPLFIMLVIVRIILGAIMNSPRQRPMTQSMELLQKQKGSPVILNSLENIDDLERDYLRWLDQQRRKDNYSQF